MKLPDSTSREAAAEGPGRELCSPRAFFACTLACDRPGARSHAGSGRQPGSPAEVPPATPTDQENAEEGISPTQDAGDGLPTTQAPGAAFLDFLDSVEDQGHEEFLAMKNKVLSATDPSAGVQKTLQRLACEAWLEATGDDVEWKDLPEIASTAGLALLDNFHHQWSRRVWDVKELVGAVGLHKKTSDQSLREFVAAYCSEFYTDLLSMSPGPDPAQAQDSRRGHRL